MAEVNPTESMACRMEQFFCDEVKALSKGSIEIELAEDFLQESAEGPDGLVGLFFAEEGFRHFFSTKKLSTIEDFKGHRIRITPDPVLTGVVNDMNAVPVELKFTDLMKAMVLGNIDTAEHPLIDYSANHFDSVAKNVTLAGSAAADCGRKIVEDQENDTIEKLIIESSSKNELKENFDNLTGKITLLCISQILIFIVIVVVFTLNINVIINPINSYMKAIKENTRLTEKGSYELRCLARIYNNYFDHKAATERRLKKNAETDSLTGIMNRHAFEQICSTFKDPQNLIFLIVDVDDFKHINDTYGHTSGDKILKIISKKLVDAFRTTDYVARIGGDEFAVLLTNFRGNINFTLRNKIKRLNKELSSIEDFGKISISVGASVSTNGFSKDMVEKADIALYKTKNEGKCGYNMYDKDSPSYVKV